MYSDEYDQTYGLLRSSHHRLQTALAYCTSAPTGHFWIAFYQPSLEKINKINPKNQSQMLRTELDPTEMKDIRWVQTWL